MTLLSSFYSLFKASPFFIELLVHYPQADLLYVFILLSSHSTRLNRLWGVESFSKVKFCRISIERLKYNLVAMVHTEAVLFITSGILIIWGKILLPWKCSWKNLENFLNCWWDFQTELRVYNSSVGCCFSVPWECCLTCLVNTTRLLTALERPCKSPPRYNFCIHCFYLHLLV